MSARTHPAAENPVGCLILLFFYLLIGGAIYLIAYGEPHGFTLSLVVVAFLWPFALVWWSLWWISVGIVLVLALLGVRHIWGGF